MTIYHQRTVEIKQDQIYLLPKTISPKKTAVLIEKQPLKTAYRSIAKQGKKILIIGDCYIGRICQNKFTNSFWHAKVHLKFLMVQQLRI